MRTEHNRGSLKMIREATVYDAEDISTLALSLVPFLSSNAERTLPQQFIDTLTTEEYVKRLNSEKPFHHFVYEIKNQIVAYISYVTMVDNTHIFHLFVDEKYHKKGIAKALWTFMLEHTSSDIYMVNSSLWAIDFYTHLGFVKSSLIEESAGLKYQPMVMNRTL